VPARLVRLVADAVSPAALAGFWSALLDWPAAGESGGEVHIEPAGFRYPGAGAVPLLFVPVPEPKAGQNRVHLHLASSSPEHQAALVRRARDLGATPADIGQRDVPWTVLADPEGNEFCVLEPR
jgi:Glyoxalase-like domain